MLRKHCPDGVEYRSLETLFEIKNGYTPSKSNTEYWKDGVVPWFRLEDIRQNGRILSDSIQHVTTKAVKSLMPANSLIISTSATIGEYALITVDFLANQRFVCLSLRKEFTDSYNIMFLRYYAVKICEWCKKNINPGKFATVDMSLFRKIPIPAPPLAVQEAIVAILDRFETLVNDLSVGLPAELAARRRQYEYYRDRLLTFQPLEQKP